MTNETTETIAATTIGVAGVLTGLGVLLFALAPFAIPILVLTAVFAAPLLIGIVPLALFGILAGIFVGIRGMWKALRGSVRRDQPARTLGTTSRASSST